jgi:HEAT repeat protein
MDTRQGIQDLIEQLKARPWKSRQEAIDRLVEFGELAVFPLLHALSFPDANAFLIAQALGQLGDLRAVEPLIELLDTSNLGVTQAAAIALGKLGDARAIYPLIDVFRHEWDDTETITTWQEAAKALVSIGDAAFVPLVAALRDEDENVRIWAMDTLKQMPPGHSLKPLLPALHDPSFQVRAQAVEAIGALGDLHSLAVLFPLLQDENDSVRMRACFSIGNRGSQKGYDALITVLHDPSPLVRRAAAINIGKVVDDASDKRPFFEPVATKKKQATDLLLTSLDDLSSQVRIAIITTLGKIGDVRIIPELQNIQQYDIGSVGADTVDSVATRAIEQIRKRYPTQ